MTEEESEKEGTHLRSQRGHKWQPRSFFEEGEELSDPAECLAASLYSAWREGKRRK